LLGFAKTRLRRWNQSPFTKVPAITVATATAPNVIVPRGEPPARRAPNNAPAKAKPQSAGRIKRKNANAAALGSRLRAISVADRRNKNLHQRHQRLPREAAILARV
jgi:hypothetical protein